MKHRLLLATLILLVISLAGCIAPRERADTLPMEGTHGIALSDAIADVVEQVMPAVVFISAHRALGDLFGDQIMRAGTGSGIIISEDGYILTNNHVVEGAELITVTLIDGRIFEATITGTDPLTDLAVIKIDGFNLPTASLGDARQLRPGNLVIAIGNPLGLAGGPTVTMGVVSNTERSFTVGDVTFYDVIQTDAAINPGNSGGPLVDLRGEVVGINTVLIGGAENIGFAISTSTADPVSHALIAPPHRVIRPWLGVLLATVTPAVVEEHRLVRTRGILVARLVDGSPAYQAGLKEGDVITHFASQEVNEATQLIKALWHHRVGDRVEVLFWRGDEEKKAIVELTVERP